MNERIEKLGEQADLLGEFTPTKIPGRYVGYITEEQILKFAELIVKECMDLALSEQKRYAEFTHRNLSECAVTVSNFRLLMKDHFGVENERD
jgi:hypothetical protein